MVWVFFVYVILGGFLSVTPLLQVLHVESAAVVAAVAFFASGLETIRRMRRARTRRAEPPLGRLVLQHLALLIVPLAALTLSMLWAPNCAYLTGLGFYVLFPAITVVFAVGLAVAVYRLGVRRPGAWLTVAGVGIMIAGPVYDLGFHPQFYTYNHVFGGVLGPIYDEQLAIRPGLFFFRGLTLLWAGVFFAVAVAAGAWGTKRTPAVVTAVVCGMGIVAIYAFSATLGLNTTPDVLQARLSGHHATASVDFYYDPVSIDSARVRALGEAYEADIARQRSRLGVANAPMPQRIRTYLYPSPDVKARLTGARTTSVAPVWLRDPQSHLLEERIDDSYSHELAHLLARPYGLPGLKASWAAGLVEGWAVALEGPSGDVSPHDLVLAAATRAEQSGTGPTLDARADAIASQLSPWGFWTGRGAVSYATMGSFVDYLLTAYGPEPLKAVYARANFASVYGRTVPTLAAEWADWLRARPSLSSASVQAVDVRFSQPSLFETTCPHYVPEPVRLTQEAERALAQGDTTASETALTTALDLEPNYARAHQQLAALRLMQNRPQSVRRRLEGLRDRLAASDTTERDDVLPVGLQYRLGVAYALDGDIPAARRLLRAAADELPRAGAGPIASRTMLLLTDAVADRPDVLRILHGPDSMHVRAQRLEQVLAPTAAVRTWTALTWLRAYRFEESVTAWQTVSSDAPVLARDVRAAWTREVDLQRNLWRVAAEYHAGNRDAARDRAVTTAAEFRRYGNEAMARVLDRWAARAVSSSSSPTRSSAASSPSVDTTLLVTVSSDLSVRP